MCLFLFLLRWCVCVKILQKGGKSCPVLRFIRSPFSHSSCCFLVLLIFVWDTSLRICVVFTMSETWVQISFVFISQMMQCKSLLLSGYVRACVCVYVWPRFQSARHRLWITKLVLLKCVLCSVFCRRSFAWARHWLTTLGCVCLLQKINGLQIFLTMSYLKKV